MEIKRKFILVLTLLVLLILQSCLTELEMTSENFQSALVIEGTITTTEETQKILLSRTFKLDEEGPAPEENATVSVTDNLGNEYLFKEHDPGVYHSLVPFSAQPERVYSLEVITEAGRLYASNPSGVPAAPGVAEIYAERTVFNGVDGIAILVDIDDADSVGGYYKYSFEETYKIISPLSYPYDLFYVNGEFIRVRKTKEERICYNTLESDRIILASTNKESANNRNRILVRFIEGKNPILAQRYSILVRQMAISEEAFVYYDTLKKLASGGNIFSQNQPGFINGNVFSLSNPDEKVIGFFTVAETEKKRIFFDYHDFFGEDEKTDPFIECLISRPSISIPDNLGNALNSGKVKYLGSTIRPGEPGEGPHMVVQAGCVDCTVLGTNVRPDFWED